MRVLLVNPNRTTQPPVPPVGLEYLVAPLRQAGHEPHLLDLTFARNPQTDLDRVLNELKPEAVGFTVRNVDSVLYHTNEFFLDEIAALVQIARATGVPVLVGGSGVATMPGNVLRYLGADYAIDGPGEGALPALLDEIALNRSKDPRVIDGWPFRLDPAVQHSRGEVLDYAPYLNAGARFGFETQKGCSGHCLFCTEALRPVLTRRPDIVADEIARLVTLGVTALYCCDSEFNQSLARSKAFLHELIGRRMPIDWSLYMTPRPHDAGLFELLERSGCSSVTLSVDTLSLYGPTPTYAEKDIIAFLAHAAGVGIKTAVDLVAGLPGEPEDAPQRAIELFRRHRPATVGVNVHMRLYPRARLYDVVQGDAALRRHVEPADPPDGVHPAFYHQLDDATIERLIAGDRLFRIEGLDPGVNYQRV